MANTFAEQLSTFFDLVKSGSLKYDLFPKLDDYVKKYTAKKSGIQEFIVNSFTNGGISLDKVTEIVTVNNDEFQIARSIYEFFVPLGLIMIVLYLLMDVLNTTTSRIREFDIKQFMMIFFKGAIGLIFIKYGFSIMGDLTSVANQIAYEAAHGKTMLALVSPDNSGLNLYFASIITAVEKGSWKDQIALLAAAAILQLTQIIPEILVIFQAISRKIEIVFRTGIAPISLPDIYNGISNSKAIMFIKRFAVVLLHGPMMIVIIKVAYRLQASYIKTVVERNINQEHMIPGIGVAIEMALYGFAAAGLISSAKSALNDAVGC